MSFADRLIDRAMQRRPDFIIGGEADPYLYRWWLIPRNPLFNVYLHCFRRSDDDRAHHTHPWLFNISWLLRGSLIEHVIKSGGLLVRRMLHAGAIRFRLGESPHRLELLEDAVIEVRPQSARATGEPCECWTLFITGPRIREWGFLCGDRFVHWKLFTSPTNSGEIGRGCN